MPQSTKIVGDDDTISVIVTKHVLGKEDSGTPGNKTPDPFLRPLPTRLVSFFVLSGLAQRTSSIARGPNNIDNFALTVRNQSVDRSSP